MPTKKGVFDRYIEDAKTFDDYPDLRADNGLENFDLKAFSDSAIDGLSEKLKEGGRESVPMKIVGVSLHLIMLNPDDESKTDIVHTELVAWHKNCGNPKKLLSRSLGEIDAQMIKTEHKDCDGECGEEKYKSGKCDAHIMYG